MTNPNRKKEKYDLILDAALRVIAEYGYRGAQVSRIAREAGVADGTIYLYFKGKEDILISLLRDRLGALIEKCRERTDAAASADAALRTVCEIHFAELERDVRLACVTQIELRQSSPELRKAIVPIIKTLHGADRTRASAGVNEGIFRGDLDVRLARQLVFGAMDEVVTSWLVAGRAYSLAAQAEQTVSFFLQGLRS